MENTQLSLLNALFGGKTPGEALLLEKPFAAEGETEQASQGFFSFLESLTATAVESGEETLNAPLAPKDVATFPGLKVEVLRKLLGDEVLSGDDAAIGATTFTVAEPQASAAFDVSSLKTNEIALSDEAALEEPVTTPLLSDAPAAVTASTVTGPAATTSAMSASPTAVTRVEITPPFANPSQSAPVRPAAAKAPGFVDPATPSIDPAQPPGVAIAKAPPVTPAEPVIAGVQVQTLASVGIVEPVGQTPPNQSAPVEPGVVDLDRRPDFHPDRPQIKTPEASLKAHNNGAAAIADHAAPEALAHSALTREGDIGGFDRMASSRLETAPQTVERNVHLNPVRDQIIAAVASRPGEAKLEIRLDPPELGRVLIGFERDGADIVRAVVTAESPDTLDLMRRNADVFQRALEQQGFSNLDLQFADRGARENAQEDPGDNARLFALADEEAGAAALAEHGPRVALGRLDRRL
ncbi:flagellar hook-length control protein FliK [Marinicaulis aureus]|uniref:Flagellar hook-length control protein FliK n=1 Tax=Hyphococcus aureus TaxID=2666033 RepID=A0ABW1KU16_9PROT